MKKHIYKIVFIVILAMMISNITKSQTHGSWVVPPYRIDFYDSGPVVSTGLYATSLYYASDAGFKHNGDLLFYIIDNEVFDINSVSVGELWDEVGQFETEVINVPGETDKFYVIGGRKIPIGGYYKYALIDCSQGTPQISTTQNITSTFEHAGIAITELNNNSRYLYLTKISDNQVGEVQKYLIDINGINYVETIVTSNDPILNNYNYFNAINLEFNQDETTLAWCRAYGDDIYIVNIDNQGNFLSSEIIPVNKGNISGIEFSNVMGNNIIYASCNNQYTGGIQQINYLTGQLGTPLTSNGSYGETFLETATDGYIYAVSNNGESLGRIDQTTNTFNPSVISSLLINSKGGEVYKLPNDETLYSPLGLEIGSSSPGCPGGGSATANPTGGTPPYTYLWSPGGQTTQSISDLNAGTYTCCVTDAVGDEVCEDANIIINPNFFDYSDEYTIAYPVTLTDWDKTFEKGIRISSGWHVTMIDCDLQFGKYGKIIVERGATLTLDNCTLTSFAECGNMWVGVEVWGYRYKSQFINPSDNIQWQGKLELKNETVIENAEIAVNLKKAGTKKIYEGGIVQAIKATFRNNAKSVHASDYINYNPVLPSQHMDNISYFNNCVFEINSEYIADIEFFKHADLDYVDGIKFKGCDFILEPGVSGVNDWNQAIAAYSAGFDVMAICTSSPGQECTQWDKCTFSGFNKAINAKNVFSTYTFWVNRAVFNNNATGIYASNVQNLAVLYSDFNIAKNTNDISECEEKAQKAAGYGIDLLSCTGFAIEENHFAPMPSAGTTTGIRIAETEATDEVYKNYFDGLDYGNYAVGINYGGDFFEGLSYFCNENTANYADFYVEPDNLPYKFSGIQSKQGDDDYVAGNKFTSTGATWHFYNGGDYLVGYYFCDYCANENPDDDKEFQVTDKPQNFDNDCPSHYGGGGVGTGKSLILSPEQKLQTEQEYYSNLTGYNNVKVLYDNLKDGGNTEATLTEVETAWPNDMWELRSELLGKSPHLSMDVLKSTADKTDVLPESIIFEIMAANPDELKKGELIKYLEDKENPLPEYMINILRQVAKGTTYKTVLEQQMAHYNQVKTRAAHDIIRSILNDSVTDLVGFRNWLDNLGGKKADEQIIASYLTENNYNDALSLANMMPSLYNYSDHELTEHNYYLDMLNLQILLSQEERSIFDLDSTEVNNLEAIAEESEGMAGTQAKGILEFAYGHHYCDCLNISDSTGFKSSGTISPDDMAKAYGLEITNEPNPASNWVAFNYTLPNENSEGIIKVVDAMGTYVTSFTVTGKQGQKIWDTSKFKPGVYFYTFVVEELSRSGKIIISR